jgi:cytochrome c556
MRARLFLLGIMTTLVVSWLVIAAGPHDAQAQSDAIAQRQAILGSFGKAVKEPGAMLRHEAGFDLAIVQASLKTIMEGAPKLKALFPDDSKSGAYTEALPVIWDKKDDFLKIVGQLAASATAASAAIKDEATFRSEWGKVSSNCRACHKVYRVLPKS